MTKVLKGPVEVIREPVKKSKSYRQRKVDRQSILAFSGDLKDWRSIVKGKDLF